MTELSQSECGAARRLVHDAADGELGDADRRQLEAHLAACAYCAGFARGLAALRDGLASLPDPGLPDEDLAAVWARTIDAPLPASATAVPRRRFARARWALAAAALALAVLAPFALRERPAEPSQPQTVRAAADVRYVFAIADDALTRPGRTAVGCRTAR